MKNYESTSVEILFTGSVRPQTISEGSLAVPVKLLVVTRPIGFMLQTAALITDQQRL